MFDLDEIQREIHKNSELKGFWPDEPGPTDYIAKMMLITSEVAEIMEAYRKSQGANAISEEFADLLIRTLDLYEAMTISGIVSQQLEQAILNKMLKNSGRPHKHNNLL